MIKKFENFNSQKSIAVYHGLGGKPAEDRIELLKSEGYTNIVYSHIDFEKEWKVDRCKSLFERELNNIKNCDVLLGFSLGGYLAYLLATKTGKNVVMVNPALDRGFSSLDIKEFDIDNLGKIGKVESFFGEFDTLVPMEPQIDFLNKNNIKYDKYVIKNMEHRTPIDKLKEIIDISNLI